MSPLLVGPSPPWRPAPAFVMELPREGLVVFDCGLSDAVTRDGEAALGIPMRWLFRSRGRPGRTLDAQMREAGMDPARVHWVIVSHLHEDHLGAAPAFVAALYTDVDLRGPVAVILGSEADGLTDAWSGPAVLPVRVPMLGVADSLNVSITAAVVLYEARRQRGLPPGDR